jgi:hypothetical protein
MYPSLLPRSLVVKCKFQVKTLGGHCTRNAAVVGDPADGLPLSDFCPLSGAKRALSIRIAYFAHCAESP